LHNIRTLHLRIAKTGITSKRCSTSRTETEGITARDKGVKENRTGKDVVETEEKERGRECGKGIEVEQKYGGQEENGQNPSTKSWKRRRWRKKRGL
jgi:hypothetical protein